MYLVMFINECKPRFSLPKYVYYEESISDGVASLFLLIKKKNRKPLACIEAQRWNNIFYIM